MGLNDRRPWTKREAPGYAPLLHRQLAELGVKLLDLRFVRAPAGLPEKTSTIPPLAWRFHLVIRFG